MFIVIFRPHQRAAWASRWDDEEDFVSQYLNGAFAKSCNADPDLEMSYELSQCQEAAERFSKVFAHVGHDLYALTRLDSPEDVERYLCERDYCGHHNKAYGQVAAVARDIGWLDDDD